MPNWDWPYALKGASHLAMLVIGFQAFRKLRSARFIRLKKMMTFCLLKLKKKLVNFVALIATW